MPIPFEHRSRPRELRPDVRHQGVRQHRHAVLLPLRIANQDLAPCQVNVLDAKRHAFAKPHASAVKQGSDQPLDAAHPFQHPTDFRARENHRQPLRPLGTDHRRQPRQVDLEHVAIEEQDRCQRLVLRRRGNLAGYSERGQKLLDFRRSHRSRMTAVVEPDEATNPVQVCLLGPIAHVTSTDLEFHLIKQLSRLGHPWLPTAVC
jgi:hypothetical protein